MGQLGDAGLNFDTVYVWSTSATLALRGTAAVKLVKYGQGVDMFSKHEIAVKALAILWYCIVGDAYGLGGALRIGSRDTFSLVFQAPLLSQNSTSQNTEMR